MDCILLKKFFSYYSLCLVFTCFQVNAGELFFNISPYIQQTSSTSVKIRWERPLNEGAYVRVGKLNSENQLQFESTLIKQESFRIHRKKSGLYESFIQGLLPNTTYYYQIILGDNQSSIYNFKTLNNKKENFSFLVMSDAQHGYEVTKKIIEESVIYHTFINNEQRSEYPPRFSLFSGDLVQHGILKKDWKKHFFTPMAPLLHRLAIYPVKGNHEMGKFFFNQYFSLPKQTSPQQKYNYYFFDYSNVRFINLDSNRRFRNNKQLKWLKLALTEAGKNEEIDFIVLQFHHPFKSEAWTWGNTKYLGEVEKIIEESLKVYDKPTVYFNGHTHAYSRGHKKTTRLSMITVGPIGGRIDTWDRWSKDYPEYHKTLHQYGWIKAEVTSGGSPTLTIKRYGFGNNESLTDNGVIDQFKIKRYAQPPERPVVSDLFLEKGILNIKTSPYESEDSHLSTEIKITVTNKRGRATEKSLIFNKHNIYNGKDHAKMKDLTHIQMKLELDKNEAIDIQVRHRSTSLRWSKWSEKVRFPSESDEL